MKMVAMHFEKPGPGQPDDEVFRLTDVAVFQYDAWVHVGDQLPRDVIPDSAKAAQAYKRGGSNAKCAARLDALRTRSR
ncbi:hypothetical protein PQR72_24400 [Paraburkholderia madseniana]|uniref:hypothetical protein n=1 Tax=Paraburkholderia madseniana TaxID=2599607 RepID=UPI0015C57E76|nr:hypothetical protein [Paraburkholderia madseniana]NPT67403.1 hypothetical protein [Paraburkholderia madseniana]